MCSLIDLSIINVLLNFRIRKQMTVEHSSTKLDLLATKHEGCIGKCWSQTVAAETKQNVVYACSKMTKGQYSLSVACAS